MFHALVRENGVWKSYGLHHPGPSWESTLRRLKAFHKEDNVTFSTWEQSSVFQNTNQLMVLMEKEAADYNEVQRLIDNDVLPERDQDGDKIPLSHYAKNLTNNPPGGSSA